MREVCICSTKGTHKNILSSTICKRISQMPTTRWTFTLYTSPQRNIQRSKRAITTPGKQCPHKVSRPFFNGPEAKQSMLQGPGYLCHSCPTMQGEHKSSHSRSVEGQTLLCDHKPVFSDTYLNAISCLVTKQSSYFIAQPFKKVKSVVGSQATCKRPTAVVS